MWPHFSISRWIFLLTVATVFLLLVSRADSYSYVNTSCCQKTIKREIKRINECYEQIPREDCAVHAFKVENKKHKWCIDPSSEWIRRRIKMGELKCPPIISSD